MSTPFLKRPFARLPLFFDPAGLRADLQSIAPTDWSPYFSDRVQTSECAAVALRSRSGAVDDLAQWGAAHEFHDTPLRAQCPHIEAAVNAFVFEKKSVRLLRLQAGSQLCEFLPADPATAHAGLHIHIPLAAFDAVELIVADRSLAIHEGQAWHIALLQPCRVINHGISDYVFLAIDGVVNDWTVALLERAARDIVSESHEPLGAAKLRAFRERVFDDPALQSRLATITIRNQFVDALVRAGAELGFAFDPIDVETALDRGRHDWITRTVTL